VRRGALAVSAVLLTGLCAALLWKLRGAGAIFIASLTVAAALRPFVDRLEALRIGRGLALGLVYVAGLALLSLSLYLVAPHIVAEVSTGTELAGAAYEQLRAWCVTGAGGGGRAAHGCVPLLRHLLAALPPASALEQALSSARLDAVAGSLLGAALDVVDAVGACLIVFALSAYWSAGRESFERLWMSLVPAPHRTRARDVARGVVAAVGAHLRGELALGAATSVLLVVGFALMRLPTPVLPALLGGLLRWVPFVGPLAAVAVAAAAGALGGPGLSLAAAVYAAITLLALAHWRAGASLRARPPSPTLVVVLAIALSDVWGLTGLLVASPLAAAVQALIEQLVATRSTRARRAPTISDLEARLAVIRQQVAQASPQGGPQLGSVLARLDRLVVRARALGAGGGGAGAISVKGPTDR
jgi:predicted PurR-regulated permease PerM